MDIFRRLGNGLSKLSVNKKGSASKSKSKTRAYRAKSDGLTYSSPFGASFRHDHDVGSISFVSPETIVIRSHEDSSEDSEDSDSSFDKPFLDQASSKDLGDRSHPTKSNFRIYRRLVHARSGIVPESESQLEKSLTAVIKRPSESIDLDSLSGSRQSQTAEDVELHERMKTSSKSYNPTFVNTADGGGERGAKLHFQDANNSDTKMLTDTGTNLMDASLLTLRSSIEGLIDSGLRFQSPYAVVGFESPTEETSPRERSQSLHRYLRTLQNLRSAEHSHDLPESGDVDAYCGRKTVAAGQCESLDSILSQDPSDVEEADYISPAVGKRGPAVRRRRSSSLSKVEDYQRHISILSSRRGSNLPTADDTLEVLLLKEDRQLGSYQLSSGLEKSVCQPSAPTGKGLLGRRSSELRNRRLAIMMCPRPYGRRNTAHDQNHSPFRYIRFSERGSSPGSGEESEPIGSSKIGDSELHTFSGLPDAGPEHSGDEFCKLSSTKSPKGESSAVDKHVVSHDVGFDVVYSCASVISDCKSRGQMEQPFQPTRNFEDFAQTKRSDVTQRICKTDAIEPCISTQTTAEVIPTFSSKGGDLQRLSLPKSVHEYCEIQHQGTSRLGDIWRKHPDLKEIKSFSGPVQTTSVHSTLSNDLPLEEVPPSMSSSTMTNRNPPSHNPLQPSSCSQVSAVTDENTPTCDRSFSYSSGIFCTKEAILKQSRKGWSSGRSGQDLDS